MSLPLFALQVMGYFGRPKAILFFSLKFSKFLKPYCEFNEIKNFIINSNKNSNFYLEIA